MNILRITWKHEQFQPPVVEDFIFHQYALLSTAQKVLERRRRGIESLEFFPGEGLTEQDIARAMVEDRFIGN